MASTTTDTPAPRASRGGFLRRHWVAFVASAAVLAILTSAAVLWWIPSRVERVVRELEHRAGDLLALEIRHSAAVLDGTRRLVVTDLVAAAEGDAPDAPLFSCRRMEVDFDPFALRDGVPTLLGVRLEGVQVHLLAEPGGNDNFRATARGVLDLLRRTGGPAEGGERSRLVRLLSQLPPVEATDVSVVAHLERGAEDEGTRSLVRIAWRRGTVSAANPSATGVEKRLQIHARFEDEDAGGTVRLDAELDRGAGTASATFRTERGLPVVLGPASLRLDGATWVRGRMLDVEAGLLRVPVPDVTALERAAEALMGDAAAAKAVGERLRAGMRRASELQERLRDMAGKAREGLVSLGYTPSVVDRVVTGWTGGLTSLVHGLREPLRRDEVSFDRVRLSRTRDGEQALEVWMFHLLQAGDAELWCRARRDLDTGDVAATWRVGLVPLGLSLEGNAAVVRGEVDADFEGRLALESPHLAVSGRGTWSEGRLALEGDLEARLGEPPLAVAASGSMRNGLPEGTLTLRTDVAGLVRDLELKALARGGTWSADIQGEIEAPGQPQRARLSASVDGARGLRSLSLRAPEPVGFDVAGWRIHLQGASLGGDSEVRLEDLTVTRAGADVSRRLLSLEGLRVRLSEPLSLAALRALAAAREEDRLEEELIARVAEVELTEPHIFLRQPNPLPAEAVAEPEEAPRDLDADIARKLEDAPQTGKRIVMHEPIRASMRRLVLGLEGRLQKVLGLFRKAGDRFPLEKVTILGGRLEYADAVAEEDRLVTDLSRFDGTLEKAPGGGSFRVDIGFRAPGTDGEVTNRIEAQVNLVTGDVTGTLELPGFPLHPYRFLAPRAVVLTPASRLVDTRLRFMWEKEKSLLRVWGAAHLNGVTVSSARLASEPLRDLDVTVELGSSPEQGLSMDLKAHVLDTGESCRTRLGRGPAVRTRLRLEGADGEYPRFLLSLVMDLTPLQQVLDSIPRPLIQQVAGMQVQGYVAAELQLSGDSGDLGNLAFDFRFTERDVSVDAWGGEVDLQKLLAPFTFRIRGGGKERKTIRVGEGPLWTPLEEVPPWVVLAVTTTEDGSFFRHDGFNRFQWKMTVIDNLEAGRFVRGASTISMQLVKNLFLGHEKTVARKLQELILTWLMEKAVPKERIIELYLNIIEWGRGVYGLAGAARHYFDRSSRELTLAQAALLATFIPHPRPFDDRFSAGRDPGARTRSWDKWWEQRLRLVKRVVRAMVNNCDKVDSKCPSSTGATCQALQRMCSSNRSVFWEAENLTSLDKVFEPAPPSDDTAVDGPDAGTAVEL